MTFLLAEMQFSAMPFFSVNFFFGTSKHELVVVFPNNIWEFVSNGTNGTGSSG